MRVAGCIVAGLVVATCQKTPVDVIPAEQETAATAAEPSVARPAASGSSPCTPEGRLSCSREGDAAVICRAGREEREATCSGGCTGGAEVVCQGARVDLDRFFKKDVKEALAKRPDLRFCRTQLIVRGEQERRVFLQREHPEVVMGDGSDPQYTVEIEEQDLHFWLLEGGAAGMQLFFAGG